MPSGVYLLLTNKKEVVSMLILDKPYVSDFLQKTAVAMQIPILDNGEVLASADCKNLNLLAEEEFLSIASTRNPLKLYCNSENSINWITKNLAYTRIPQYIDLCKDKVKFRQLIQPLYPDFYFREVDFQELESLDVAALKKPFIIKPAVGFFSIGVYKVTSDQHWKRVVKLLRQDISAVEGLYPAEVMNSTKFIIEECIDGDEFAIDAYYNALGKPVILNILKHPFQSATDVSDRVYYTSKEIMLEYLEQFENVLQRIGDSAGFSNFPVHVEVRIDSFGKITPIEFNPIRFAGWCVTDLAYFAYGINTYEYYFNDKKPEWKELLEGKDGKVFSLVLVDMPKGYRAENIESFDYVAVAEKFSKVLELRKIDFHKYPIFAFFFIETLATSNELEKVLEIDFSDFITEN